MKKILFACDSFKGTLPSFKVGEAAELGFRQSLRMPSEGNHPADGSENITKHIEENPPSSCSSSTEIRTFRHCPMSDGGGGLIDSLTYRKGESTGYSASAGAPPRSSSSSKSSRGLNLLRVNIPREVPIHGPLGEPISSSPVSFACDVEKRVLLVEMAEAAGLARIPSPSQRSPWDTTSYGVGEIILYALRYMEEELRKAEGEQGEVKSTKGSIPGNAGITVLLGIGGSATNEGGLGALQALGVDIYLQMHDMKKSDESVLLAEPFKGKHLALLHHIVVTEKLKRLFAFKVNEHQKKKETAVMGLDNPNLSLGLGSLLPGIERCFVEKMFLICDVENPLVGPRGATFIFGPQKCSPVVSGSTNAEDAAVGTVKSAAQTEMLQLLEQGMEQAGIRVVESSWEIIRDQREEDSHLKNRTEREVRAELERELLHSPRGGGAGGMSGFFRYLLNTSCLSGADTVAGLQGLRVVGHAPWEVSSVYTAGSSLRPTATPASPHGFLFEDYDTLVTGEGSFDEQSIFSRKTVGKLLEMVVEANAWRALRHPAVPFPRIERVVVLCGRCGFKSSSEAVAGLQSVLLQEGKMAGSGLLSADAVAQSKGMTMEEVIKRSMPTLHIAVLTERVSVQEAMTDPYGCIVRTIEHFVKRHVDQPHSSL